MTRGVVDALRKKQLVVATARVKAWAASGLAAIEVDGCTIESQGQCRVLGLHVGARDHETCITAAWKAFWPLREALIARSFATSVRSRWKAKVASALTFGGWSWRWSHEVWRTVSTTVIRMLRIMAHISRRPAEPWLDWKIRSWRRCQTWMFLKEAAPCGTKIMCQAAKRCDPWTALNTRCALAHALYLHPQVNSERTTEL